MRIGFLSFRLAGTDGVSLEVAKWAHIYEQLGHQVFFCAGELDPTLPGSLVEEMHFTHPAIRRVNAAVFGQPEIGWDLAAEIHRLATQLVNSIHQFVTKNRIDVLIAENVLAIPMNVPLGVALTRFLAASGMPAVGHHHDFYWERERFAHPDAQLLLEEYFTPRMPNLKHVVINYLAQESLRARCGVDGLRVPNIFNFSVSAPGIDPFSADLRPALGIGDDQLMVLQPTRVIRRKGIELALELVRRLRLPSARRALQGREVLLVITHAGGDEGMDYLKELTQLAHQCEVPLIYAPERFAPAAGMGKQGKIYSLWSAYVQADFVTYPSLYEGFGNAFLETIYFRLPLLVNRYPVYISDLRPLGFDVVEIDGVVNAETVEKCVTSIVDPVIRRRMVEKNFEIAREHFSYEAVAPLLESLLHPV